MSCSAPVAQLDTRPHEPVVELKLSLLDATRVETASPGSWAISVDGERVLGDLDDAAVALILRQALASTAAPLVAAVLVAVGAWPLPLHQGEPRTSNDDS